MQDWVKMPSNWLREGELPLTEMKWQGANKSDNIAALMVYIVMLHHANAKPIKGFPDVGFCKVTYDALSESTSLSREKVSNGIQILCQMKVIQREKVGRSNIYKIENYPYPKEGGWAKIPAGKLYSYNYSQVKAFKNFKLRSKVELNALKIYLLIAAFRENDSNTSQIGYNKISAYTGVRKNDIKKAISMLIASELLTVDSMELFDYEDASKDLPSEEEKTMYSHPNVYRLCYIDSNRHRGNKSTDEFAEKYDREKNTA